MKAQELLAQIRSAWLQRVSNSLARGTDAREAFRYQLQQFFDSLERAMSSGNPAWIDSILLEWTSSPTLTDLQHKKNNVAELLNKIIAITNDVAIENLPEEEALDLRIIEETWVGTPENAKVSKRKKEVLHGLQVDDCPGLVHDAYDIVHGKDERCRASGYCHVGSGKAVRIDYPRELGPDRERSYGRNGPWCLGRR